MCTAAVYRTKDFYFGRTLDYEFSYGDEVVVTPRGYNFALASGGVLTLGHSLIGMAHVERDVYPGGGEYDYPLYYEAANDCGLCMAGLNFVGNAYYRDPVKSDGVDDITQFELILWILGQCATVDEVRDLVGRINITNVAFGAFPVASLHWIIADRERCVVLESVREGIMIYENPVGVMTNNPAFPEQMQNLRNYMGLSAKTPESRFAPGVELTAYSRGMGAIGLPGDLSSQSRFVRAAFVANNSVSGDGEVESVGQFFHILGAVDQQRGCCELEDGKFEVTIYTCCINAERGIYYYTTYNNHRITAVDMHKAVLDGGIARYRVNDSEQICYAN